MSYQPEPKTMQRSKALTDCIRQAISKQSNGLAFDQYMSLALYHPQWGYYNAEDMQIGAKGDFITAPHLSPLFGACLARQCQEILQHLGQGAILELGAGMGKLAADILTNLREQDGLPQQYFIVEPSPSLRAKQQAYLNQQCAFFIDHIHWVESIPENFVGVMLANEVLDALPVKRFAYRDNQFWEMHVVEQRGEFAWLEVPAQGELQNHLTALIQEYPLPQPYYSEYHVALGDFLKPLCRNLQAGVILFADYGYGRNEYYHPERANGTLTCFYRHQKNDNPLRLPGLQDMTAHIDFTSVIETAYDDGVTLAGFTSQSNFLLACHLPELINKASHGLNEAALVNLNLGIKKLTLPTEMGDIIKFMGLKKAYNKDITGFKFYDRSREL